MTVNRALASLVDAGLIVRRRRVGSFVAQPHIRSVILDIPDIKAEVAARGLNKLQARVCTSSCLDQCATGVTVLVEPDHFLYGRVTVADVPEIVDGLVKGQPVKRLLVTADQL